MQADVAARLRALPKVDTVLARPDVAALDAPRWAVVEAVRGAIDEARARLLAGEELALDAGGAVAVEAESVARRVARLLAPSLGRLVNATGVVLHTNLGRAPLGARALDQVLAVARGYSDLEYDVDAGRRGSRHAHVRALLRRLTGAEDALVVNNNAAAVMLCLAALAAGRAVVVSRGELVEIGGSFRVPDVMALSGARLVEVGTTNKTRIDDYRAAIGADTAMLLKVHPSNFAVVGFTLEATMAEISTLGRERGLVTMMDLGSGSLLAEEELRGIGLEPEPSVTQVVAGGIDVVTFSGDKLLGGPQAGIICGKRDLLAKVRAHPLMRALRSDKLTLAALEATLAVYRDRRAMQEIPAWRMLAETRATVRARAEAVLACLDAGALARAGISIEVVPCESTVGGGAMPLSRLPSHGLAVSGRTRSARDIERALRDMAVPIVGRIVDEQVLLDVRTVADDEIGDLARGLASLAG